jgi:hypothetical protein
MSRKRPNSDISPVEGHHECHKRSRAGFGGILGSPFSLKETTKQPGSALGSESPLVSCFEKASDELEDYNSWEVQIKIPEARHMVTDITSGE